MKENTREFRFSDIQPGDLWGSEGKFFIVIQVRRIMSTCYFDMWSLKREAIFWDHPMVADKSIASLKLKIFRAGKQLTTTKV